MRFIVDAQLPPALARWLTAQGHGADHVADRQLASASDTTIWTYATDAAAAIITKDEDFAQRKALSDTGPAIIWIRTAEHAAPGAALVVRDRPAGYRRRAGTRRDADRGDLRPSG